MKRFESYEELLMSIGVSKNDTFANNELNSYLECEGSCIVNNIDDEPKCTFMLDTDEDIHHNVGVTAIEVNEEEFKYYYWLQ